MTDLEFRVYGTPGAQGSKKSYGGGRMVESSKKVAPWRQDVVAAALAALEAAPDYEPVRTPAAIRVKFIFKRPANHYGTGRNATQLKPSAPVFATSRSVGDVDKLQRSTFDALTTAGVWDDDSLAAVVTAQKVYSNGEPPGAEIRVSSLAVTP